MSILAVPLLLLALQAPPSEEARTVEQWIEQFRKDWHSQTGDEDPRAFEALVKLGQPAVAALARELANPDPGIAVRAAGALGSMGAPAVPALASALTSAPDDVRVAAAFGLLRAAAAGTDITPARAALLTSLKHADPRLRARSAEVLGLLVAEARLSHSEAGPVIASLTAALGDSDPAVAFSAAEALRQFGPAAVGAVAALEKLAKSKDHFVRDAARGTLAEIRTLPAAIGRALEEDDPARRRLVLMLGLMGPAARGLVSSLRAMEARETDPSLRAAIAEAIARIEAK